MPKYYLGVEGNDDFVIEGFENAKKQADEEVFTEGAYEVFIYELKLVGKVVAGKPTFVPIEPVEKTAKTVLIAGIEDDINIKNDANSAGI